jgi:hypothetical protein
MLKLAFYNIVTKLVFYLTGPAILTFAVDGMANTGNEMPTISSKQEFSSSSNSFTIAPGKFIFIRSKIYYFTVHCLIL